MQIEKAPANQENIFISLTAGGANAHNTTKYILFAARFFFWLCCEHLQLVRCKIEEVVFLICRYFFYLQRVELSQPPYISHQTLQIIVIVILCSQIVHVNNISIARQRVCSVY